MNCKKTVSTFRRYTVTLLLLFSTAFYIMLSPVLSHGALGDVHSINGTLAVSNLPASSEAYIRLYAQDTNYIYPETFIEQIDAGTSYSLAVFEGTYDVYCYVYIYTPANGWNNFLYEIDPNLSVTGDTPLNITIPTVQLSGVVRDSNGIPVSGGRVRVSNGYHNDDFYPGTDGAYQFITLTGTNYLDVYPPSAYQPLSTSVDVSVNTEKILVLQDTVVPTTYSLSGTVTIDNLPGDFTSSITVYVSGHGSKIADPSTGEYAFDVPAGTYNVYTYVDIYNPDGGYTDINYYVIDSAAVVTTGDVVLGNFPLPTVLISGTIKDSLGGPVPDNTYINTSGNSINDARAYTDIDGNYRFLLFPGNYNLQVNTTPKFIETITVSVSGTVDITSNPVQTVSGSVTFDNLPADFDSEIVISFEDVSGVYPEAFVTTGGVGPGPFAYSLPVFEGTYNVYVTIYTYPPNGGYVQISNYTAASDFAVTVEAIPTLNIIIPTFILSGRVTDSADLPVSGTEIYTSAGSIYGDVYTEADGTYQFPMLDGSYTVYVYPPSPYRSKQYSLTISDNFVQDVVLDPIHSIYGTATIDNLPVGFTSSIRIYAGGPTYTDTTADANGQYSLDVSEGPYNLDSYVYIYPPNGAYLYWYHVIDPNLSVTGDTLLDIAFPTKLLSGTVKDFDGTPVPDTEFYYNNYNSIYDVTGVDGIYEILMFPGTYNFIVRPPPSLHPPFYLENVDLSTDRVLDLQFGQLDFINHGGGIIITASAETGGTIDPSGNVTVVEGGSQTFTFTPPAGHYIYEVLVNGDYVGQDSSYTLTNVTENKTIHVNFADIPTPTGNSMDGTVVESPVTTSHTLTTTAGGATGSILESYWRSRRADIPPFSLNDPGVSGTGPDYELMDLEPGLKYVWQVSYKYDNNSTTPWSDEYGFLVGTEEPDVPIPPVAAGTGIANYVMRSITHWPSGDSSCLALMGSYDTRYLRIGTYNATDGAYIECDQNLEILPGRAYWVLARDGLYETVDGVRVSLAADIEVPLDYGANGWNMVASPNEADYYWAKVQIVEYDANGIEQGVVDIDDPIASTHIDTRLWRWENGSYVSETLIDDPIMWQNEGYWVKALVPNVSLRFPADPAARVAQADSSSPFQMIARKFNKGLFRLKQVFATPEAVADGGDSPPLPMGSLTDSAAAAGGCFIATAAYGSYMEPHVTTLRYFRDSYLLTNKPGTAFVKAYYRYSPPIAHYIAEHDSLKSIVRIGLAPLVGFSFLAIHYGMMVALTVFLSALTLIIGGISFAIKTREAKEKI